MKVLFVVGARPNFIKIAPLIRAAEKEKMKYVLVHTGQHYDFEMSKVFFLNLGIPSPKYNLGVISKSSVMQIAEIIKKMDSVLTKENPDIVILVGDVNSTMAGALVANKHSIPIAHVEAGLRSFDPRMPEETNRSLTDHLSDYLFVTEKGAINNLLNEGIKKEKIFFVGNVMIDSLLRYKERAQKLKILKQLDLRPNNYIILTIHRLENVEDKHILNDIVSAILRIQKSIKIIWPIHPRTKKQLRKFSLLKKINNADNLKVISPLGYLEMMSIMINSKLVMTDSGGIQEETTALGVPCLTIRENTERPITVEIGTNKIIGTKQDNIVGETLKILDGKTKKGEMPSLWDGKASERIIKVLKKQI